ncbi:MAG TPA: hypothetical protein VF546_24860 [Pyrinomonadaceae bacterium]|jgi:hypothetical protein
MAEDVDELTDAAEAEVRERVVRLGFGGDRKRFERFCETLCKQLPRGTGVVIRGSAVTGERWEDGAPFDADGPGTSDLDVTLVGADVMECWLEDEYYIPALHTKPAGDKTPHAAPALNALREELQRIAGRPVNFQATSNLVLFARDVLFGQPYHILVETCEGAPSSSPQGGDA